MSCYYHAILDKIGKDPRNNSQLLRQLFDHPKNFIISVGASPFRKLWTDFFRKEGFYECYLKIYKEIFLFFQSMTTRESPDVIKLHDSLVMMLVPEIVTCGLEEGDVEEIMRRVKAIRRGWRLGKEICGHFLAYFQSKIQKHNTFLKTLLSNFLQEFKLTEPEVHYQLWALTELHQAVGETLYLLATGQEEEEDLKDIFYNLISSNKKRLAFLLSKLEGKPETFGIVLTEVTLPQSNRTRESQLTNVLILLLLFQHWDSFKFLKEPITVDVFSEAFQRIMYLLYRRSRQLCLVLLELLALSSVWKRREFLQKLVHHLVVLYKIYQRMGWKQHSIRIQQIWKEYCHEISINQKYLALSPPFVAEKAKEPASFQIKENRSLFWSNLTTQLLESKHSKESRNSRKSHSETFTSKLRYWVYQIEAELRRFSLEKVFLLLEGFQNLVNHKLTEERHKEKVLVLLTTIVKKIEKHQAHRFHCQLLSSSIYHLISSLNSAARARKINYDDQVMNLELYSLCDSQQGFIDLDQFFDFHHNFSFQEPLQVIVKMKIIREKESRSHFSALETYERELGEQDFEGRLFRVIQATLDQSKHEKLLLVLAELLLLRSQNVTNNLLVNFISWNFSRTGPEEPVFVGTLSGLMMEELRKKGDMARVRLFLKMDTIFESLQQRKKEKVEIKFKEPVSAKYFRFLANQMHLESYLYFSQLYEELHYLKESIFFLERYFYVRPEETTKAVQERAINLYRQVDACFSENLPYIAQRLGLEVPETVERMKKEQDQLLHSIHLLMAGQTSLLAQEAVFEQDQLSFQFWFQNIQGKLQHLYTRISEQAEPSLIMETFVLLDILVELIKLRKQQAFGLPVPESVSKELVRRTLNLKNAKSQLTIIRYLKDQCEGTQNGTVFQEVYLNKLLETRETQEMQAYLYAPQSQGFREKDLIFHVRFNYQEGKYVSALSYIKEYRNCKLTGGASEVNQIDLECRFKSILNFELSDYLSYLNKALTVFEGGQDKALYFQYYFKMFRMLFKRYTFFKKHHNDSFMQVFLNFLNSSKILSLNQDYIQEAIFYWLRFVLEQFHYSGTASQTKQHYGTDIVHYFQTHSQQFIPYSAYLLKRVSNNPEKNNIIITILLFVLSQNPEECVWTVSFLKNFKKAGSKQKGQDKDQQTQLVGMVYDAIYKELVNKERVNAEVLQFIDSIVDYALKDPESRDVGSEAFKKSPVPEGIPFLFSRDLVIDKINEVKNLGHGKSRPLELKFSLRHRETKNYHFRSILIKSVSPKYPTMESSVANFFSDIGILDKDITYKIFHLTRTLVAIEYVEHVSTINSLITREFPVFRQVERLEELRSNKFKSDNNIKTDQSLNMFDATVVEASKLIKMSRLILKQASSVSHWWEISTNFVKTHAQWSYIGYVVGLGDRHLDNILFTQQWKLIHIDFEYALDIGLNLPFPEWVPFRLTTCLSEPLGVLGIYGLYYSEMIQVAKKFIRNEANSWKAISHLSGILDKDLTVPLLVRSKMGLQEGASIEVGIGDLIQAASEKRDLRRMYKGWTPYL